MHKTLLKVTWNFLKNCVKFFWKLREIFFFNECNSFKNCVKLSHKIWKVLLKIYLKFSLKYERMMQKQSEWYANSVSQCSCLDSILSVHKNFLWWFVKTSSPRRIDYKHENTKKLFGETTQHTIHVLWHTRVL